MIRLSNEVVVIVCVAMSNFNHVSEGGQIGKEAVGDDHCKILIMQPTISLMNEATIILINIWHNQSNMETMMIKD